MTDTFMIGGAKFQKNFLEWSKQSTQLFMSVLVVILSVWIIFADKLSLLTRWQLSTTVGRLLLLLLLYMFYVLGGWEVAFIFTIAIALTWASRPLLKPVEVTEGYSDVKETKAAPHRWFVEKTLHENPVSVVEDRVETAAIQENFSARNVKQRI
jgi:hypothetical protein